MSVRARVVRGSFWATCVVVAASALPAQGSPPGVVTPVKAAPQLSLTTADGVDFRLTQHRGEVVVVTFGYALCPDVCPLTLVKLAQLRARLGAAAADVRVVFVTLDPERDTPARLGAYTRGFDRTFLGLTGTPKAVAQARDAYGVIAGRRGDLIDHSSFVFVIDRAGLLRFVFPADRSVEEMTRGIITLLN